MRAIIRTDMSAVIKLAASGISILLILIPAILIPAAEAVCSSGSAPTEEELFNRAFELNIDGEYEKAAGIYEQLLRLYPGTRNEGVYRELAVIYEDKLLDFSKAVQLYEKYLNDFSGGRLSDRFHEKYNFLEDTRPEWEVIREYRVIQRTYYSRKVKENIKLMEELLLRHHDSCLVPDIYSWLAWEYHHISDFTRGKEYIEKYLTTFPENGKPAAEKTDAYNRYAVILQGLHQYSKALNVLKKAYNESPGTFIDYEKKVYTVKKEWILWSGFLLSLGYFAFVLGVIIWLAPWQRKCRGLSFKIIRRGIILVFSSTLLPMLILYQRGYGLWNTFITLAVVESMISIIINLLTPLVWRFSRRVFITVSLLLTLAGIYFSFYIWDTLAVFYTRPGY